MNNPPPPVATRPRRRWPRRLLVLLLIFVGLPAGYYFYTKWSLDADIARAIAETDALDPRWRFDDMEADRKAIPDADNSALETIKIAPRISHMNYVPVYNKHYGPVFEKLPSSAQLNHQQLEMIRKAFGNIPEVLATARKLKDMPNGRFALTRAADGFTYLLPNPQDVPVLPKHHDVRVICDLLRHDAMLLAHQGDPDAALESCMALLNAARSLEGAPFVVSVLIRVGGDSMLVQALERTLAQGHSKPAPLKELQDRIRRERADLHAHWITAVRGDRALHHQFSMAIHQGEIGLGAYMKSLHVGIGFQDRLANYWPGLYTKRYPEHLRYRNQLVAAAQLPLEKQCDQFRALARKVDRGPYGQAVSLEFAPLLPPDLSRSCDVHLVGQAILVASEAGLACERFRIAHKRWPESLAEVVKNGMLEAIPSDPYDGQPLRFVRLKDGLAVYSVGYDKQDNGGNIRRDHPDAWGADPGFRLWDPEHRRQPPQPPVALQN